VGTALGARRLSHLWHKQSSLESWEEMCERSPLLGGGGGGGCSAAANGLHADGIVTLNCWVALCECIRPSKVMRGSATESAAAEMHSNALLCSERLRPPTPCTARQRHKTLGSKLNYALRAATNVNKYKLLHTHASSPELQFQK
jgi:hypothetical protein